jgi:hypothetical protein
MERIVTVLNAAVYDKIDGTGKYPDGSEHA